PLRIRVVDGVPRLVRPQGQRDFLRFEQVQPIPEEEMRGAKKYNQSRPFTVRQPVQGFQTLDTHQNEQAGDGRDVVKLERGKKIDAQGENQRGKQDPDKPVLADGNQKRQQRQVKRRQKEEAVVADAILQALQVFPDRIGTAAAKRELHL